MAHLSLSCLGPFQVTLDGQPVTSFKSNKVRALLAFLAVEADRPHRREVLAGLLWPDWPDRDALSNLRYTLSDLRRAIGDRNAQPSYLLIARETLQFNPASDHWLDVAAFSDLTGQEDLPGLEEAITLYRGSFLEGFSLADSAPFEEWTLFTRERLARRMSSALHRLAAACEQSGEYSGSDTGLSALAYTACTLWCLGYPDRASQRSQTALALARELNHPFTLADVLAYGGCLFNAMRRDAQALKDNAEELMRLSREKVPVWLVTGKCFLGRALVLLGQVQEGLAQLREGITMARSSGPRIDLSRALASWVEAQARAARPEAGLSTLEEWLTLVEETDERYWEAELYRLRAELLLMQGEQVEAESSLQHALEVARRQNARSWELRATTSLARLWQAQGKVDEARQMLAEIYDWFTEGFDTPDLQEARAMLDELA